MPKKGINIEDVKWNNRALIVNLMRKNDVTTRTALARMSGLQQATITNIINDFIACGLVSETGLIAGDNGRRIVGIKLNCEKHRIISVQISQVYFTVATFDICCNQYAKKQIRYGDSESVPMILDKIKDEIRRQRKLILLQKELLIGIGIAAVGPFASESAHITIHTGIAHYVSQSIKEALEEEFNVPIYFKHDAKAAAYMEWQKSFNEGDKGTLFYIMTGLWLGSGIVINGHIVNGHTGMAGEIGHMSIDYTGIKCECGCNGCLEQYASYFAIARMLKEKVSRFPTTSLKVDSSLEEVLRMYVNNDPLAIEIMDEVAKFLGIGISNIIMITDPDIIVIGNYFVSAGPRFLKVVLDSVKSHTMPGIFNQVTIRFSENEDACLRGITMLAIEDAVRNNRIFNEM